MKGKKNNFLLVDDSKFSRFIIKKMIEQSEISINEIFVAEDGKEALDILAEKEVDLIITDIVMPIMDGMELIKHVKNSEHADIPIIPVSSLGSKKELEIFKGYGIKYFITKSITQEKLNNILRDTLN